MTEVGVVVLCGGTSRRLGVEDKTALVVAGRPLLDHVLTGLPPSWPVVAVGTPRPTTRDVTWTRETPALGGPVAGLAAGLSALAPTEQVVVLAGDQPFAGPIAARLADALRAATAGHLTGTSRATQGVCASGPDGRPQALLAAYDRLALTRVIPAEPNGAGVYATVRTLELATLDVDGQDLLDVDDPHDLARLRSRLAAYCDPHARDHDSHTR